MTTDARRMLAILLLAILDVGISHAGLFDSIADAATKSVAEATRIDRKTVSPVVQMKIERFKSEIGPAVSRCNEMLSSAAVSVLTDEDWNRVDAVFKEGGELVAVRFDRPAKKIVKGRGEDVVRMAMLSSDDRNSIANVQQRIRARIERTEEVVARLIARHRQRQQKDARVREIMDALASIADEYDKALSSMDVGNLTDEDWRGIEGELCVNEIQDFVSYDSSARRIKPRSDEEIAKHVMIISDADIVKVRVRTERARKKAETLVEQRQKECREKQAEAERTAELKARFDSGDVEFKYGAAFRGMKHNALYMDIEDGVTMGWCREWMKAHGFECKEVDNLISFVNGGNKVTLEFEGVAEKGLAAVHVRFADAVEKAAVVEKYRKLFGADFGCAEHRGDPQWDRNTASDAILGFEREVEYVLSNGCVKVDFTIYEPYGLCYYSQDTILSRRLLSSTESNTRMISWGNDIADFSLDVTGKMKVKRGGEVARMSKEMKSEFTTRMRAALKECQKNQPVDKLRSIHIRSVPVADKVAELKEEQKRSVLKARELESKQIQKKALSF